MLKLATGVNTLGIIQALARQPELWGAFGRDPSKVELRGTSTDEIVNFPGMDLLWQVRPLIFSIMTQVEGEVLGSVSVHRVMPGEGVDLGPKGGFQQYLALLDAKPGVLIGPMMSLQGDVWWTGVSTTPIVNNSGTETWILGIELQPSAPSTFVPPAVEATDGDIPA